MTQGKGSMHGQEFQLTPSSVMVGALSNRNGR